MESNQIFTPNGYNNGTTRKHVVSLRQTFVYEADFCVRISLNSILLGPPTHLGSLDEHRHIKKRVRHGWCLLSLISFQFSAIGDPFQPLIILQIIAVMKPNKLTLLGYIMSSETALGFSSFNLKESTKRRHIAMTPNSKQMDLSGVNEITENKKSRRRFFNDIISGMVGGGALNILTSVPKPAEAACLSGDDRPECIGVYKVPIDDRIESMIDTPEHLATFAPDLKWVPITPYPPSPQHAKEDLATMEDRLQNIIALVQKGDLNNAGTEILSIVPRITVDGRMLVSHLEKNDETSMRALRSENAHQDLLSSLGSSDIVLGQALAGRLGSITVAQIQILEELNQAKISMQELLRAIPDNL